MAQYLAGEEVSALFRLAPKDQTFVYAMTAGATPKDEGAPCGVTVGAKGDLNSVINLLAIIAESIVSEFEIDMIDILEDVYQCYKLNREGDEVRVLH